MDEFKSYEYTSARGQKNLLGPGDRDDPTFSFYTVKNGTPTVLCDVKYVLPPDSKWAGGLPNFRAKSWPVGSVRPDYVLTSPVDGLAQLHPPVTPDKLLCGPGQATIHGQEWPEITIEVPAASGFGQVGQGCVVQLVTSERHIYRNVPPPPPPPAQPYVSQFEFKVTGALDNSFPYPYGVTLWSLPNKGLFIDSPFEWLTFDPNDGGGTDWHLLTVADSFETWAMYKPPQVGSQGTTWIPIAKYTWNWSGTADKQSGAWQLTAYSHPTHSAPAQNFMHPTWSQYVTGSTWVPVP